MPALSLKGFREHAGLDLHPWLWGQGRHKGHQLATRVRVPMRVWALVSLSDLSFSYVAPVSSAGRTPAHIVSRGSIRRVLFLLFLLSALHLLLYSLYLTGTFTAELRPFVPQARKKHLSAANSFLSLPFLHLFQTCHTFFHDREHLLLRVCTVPSNQGPPSG